MKILAEQWKPVPLVPKYAVSDQGRVKNLIRNVLLPQRTRGRWKYLCVDFHNHGRRTFNIHRLVAQLFLPSPSSPKHQVAHNDGDPTNNRASNLRWATRLENVADCIKHGTKRQGEKVNTAKLSERDVRNIRSPPDSRRILAERYGVTIENIGLIQRRINWKHVL